MGKRNRNKNYQQQVPQSFGPKCYHMGQKRLWTLPGGGYVYAGARADINAAGMYSLILDCSGNSANVTMPSSSAPLTIAGPDVAQYREVMTFGNAPSTRLCINWPDGSVPPVQPEFWGKLLDTITGNLCVCCFGAHGRTGTALVALYMAQHGKTDPDVTLYGFVEHIRSIHCPHAVETDAQCAYLELLASHYGIPNGPEISPSSLYFDSVPATKVAASSPKSASVTDVMLGGWSEI